MPSIPLIPGRGRRLPGSIARLAALLLLLIGARAGAASNGVRDAAHFFSPQAISQAGQIIQQIQQRHHKDLLIESVPDVPQDLRDQLQQQGKNRFFVQWAQDRARKQGVNGVYVLICRDPAHLQVLAGAQTRQRLFTLADRDALSQQMLSAFRQHNYDGGLIQGAQFVLQQMNAHGGSGTAGAAAVPPAGFPNSNNPNSGNSRSWGLGGIACVVIAAVLLIVLFRGVFGRSRGGYYGGGAGYPQGGNYPPGAYPPGGGGYGGGGGMGRGFLGGLLGGALGGYAAEKWMGHGQQQPGGYAPPPADTTDPGSGVDTSYNSTGGDFGDAGGGAAGPGDSGGGDFGGGGDAGGGGDFGGGDAGGSGGGDF